MNSSTVVGMLPVINTALFPASVPVGRLNKDECGHCLCHPQPLLNILIQWQMELMRTGSLVRVAFNWHPHPCQHAMCLSVLVSINTNIPWTDENCPWSSTDSDDGFDITESLLLGLGGGTTPGHRQSLTWGRESRGCRRKKGCMLFLMFLGLELQKHFFEMIIKDDVKKFS